MRNATLRSIASWATKPSIVLNRLIPLGYFIYLVGFSVSAAVRLDGQHPRLEDWIMSDLLSPKDNPKGFLISAAAAVLGGLLLLPTVGLFLKIWRRLDSHLGILGVWLYGSGLLAGISAGVLTPFQRAYVPIHLYLAFFAFMSLVAGLGICLAAVARVSHSARLRAVVAAVLLLVAFIYLTYVFFTPQYFVGRRWLIALLEWVLSALIAVCTVLFTMVASELAMEAQKVGQDIQTSDHAA